MYEKTATMGAMLEVIGVDEIEMLLAETGDPALDMVNRQLFERLTNISSAQLEIATVGTKLVDRQAAMTEQLAKGQLPDASWLTHYSEAIAAAANRLTVAAQEITVTAGLRKLLLARPR